MHKINTTLAFTFLMGLMFLSGLRGADHNGWEFSIGTGVSYSLPSYASFIQKHYPRLTLTAHFQTRPLEFPLYYSAKIGYWQNNRSYELEIIHLKLYLKKRPSEIQYFAISHGFNLILFNRGFQKNVWRYRIGAGLILAHPENTVRYRKLPENRGLLRWGYYISGGAFQFGGERFIYKRKRMGLSLEGKVTLAYARIPIVNGHANLLNASIQGILSWHIR